MLPATAPPLVVKVVMADEGTIEVQHRTFQTVAREELVTQVEYIQQVRETTVKKESVAAKGCQFFTITKEGKLEAVEAREAATLLKQPTSVLIGTSAEVDPRHLELIRPGTVYVVLPPPKDLVNNNFLPLPLAA